MPYPYTPTVPVPGHLPSQDVQAMQTNTLSISGIVAVDHYGFGDTNAGQHKQITLPLNVAPALPAGLVSLVFSVPGVANNAASQLIYANSAISLPVSGIRAFAIASNSSNYGATVPLNGYNVTSVASSGATLTVIMPAGVVNGTNYSVICSSTRGIGGQDQITIVYNIVSATQFTLTTVDVSGNVLRQTNSISFMILQF